MSTRARWWLAGAIAFVFFGIPTIVDVVQRAADWQPAEQRQPVTGAVPGYALGTPFMDLCESDANKSSDNSAQFAFLDRHVVSLVIDVTNGHTWLDYRANKDGDPSLVVRYFAGVGDRHPCTFGLVKTANHPENDAVVQRFMRAGALFTPAANEFCYSSAPPSILPSGPNGENVATLRCDILDKE